MHPNWVFDNMPSSQAFRPTTKDKNKLSVYDGDQITAKDSWTHFTEIKKLISVGVVCLTVNECQALALPVVPDAATFKEHVLIDMTFLSNSRIRSISELLRDKANSRGWQYQATN